MTATTDPLAVAAAQREKLWQALAHGDDGHRAWLREAIDAFFAEQPMPSPRGGGTKDREIAQLRQQLDATVKERAAFIDRIGGPMVYDRVCECTTALEAAGMGKPGKPNTLIDMVLEATAELARLREQGSVIRGGPGVVLPEGWFAEGGNSTWWGIVKSDGTTPGCYYGRNYFPLPAPPAETPQPSETGKGEGKQLSTLEALKELRGGKPGWAPMDWWCENLLDILIAREAGCQNT